MSDPGDRAAREADLLEAVVEAASSPGKVVEARRRGWSPEVHDSDPTVRIEVDRAPGGSYVAAIRRSNVVSTRRFSAFELIDGNPSSARSLVEELDWSFDQWNVVYSEPCRFIVAADYAGATTVDEPWKVEASPADVAARLRLAVSGRGGVVAIGLPGNPAVVCRLTVMGIARRRVRAVLEPLLGEEPPARWTREWSLREAVSNPGDVLAAVVAALRYASGAGANDVGAPEVRLEEARMERGSRRAGCDTVVILWAASVAVGGVLTVIGLPRSTWLERISGSSASDGFAMLTVQWVVLAVGAVLVAMVGAFAKGQVERMRLPYRIQGATSIAIHAVLYAAWVYVIMFMPIGDAG